MASLDSLLAARKAAAAEGNTAAVKELDQMMYEAQGLRGGNTRYDQLLYLTNLARMNGDTKAVSELHQMLGEELKVVGEEERAKILKKWPFNAFGGITSFGEGARQAIGQATNFMGAMPTDEQLKESADVNKPLRKAYPISYESGHGSIAVPPQVLLGQVLGPAAAKPGFFNALGRTAATTGVSAAGGAVFSQPGERAQNAVTSAALAAPVSLIGEGFKAFARGGEMRANREMLKLVDPSNEDLMEAYTRATRRSGNPLMPLKEAYESEGKTLRNAGLGKATFNDYDRHQILARMKSEGATELEQVIAKADAAGASVNGVSLRNRLIRAMDELYPPHLTQVDPQVMRARNSAIRLINAYTNSPANAPGTPVSKSESLKRLWADKAGLAQRARDMGIPQADLDEAFMTKASGAMRDEVESAVGARDPDLLRDFMAAKEKSGLGMTYEPMARGAVAHKFRMGLGGQMGTLKGATPSAAINRGLIGEAMQRGRPYAMATNDMMNKLYNLIPESSDDALTAALMDALRNK